MISAQTKTSLNSRANKGLVNCKSDHVNPLLEISQWLSMIFRIKSKFLVGFTPVSLPSSEHNQLILVVGPLN